jgi:phospholipase/carboxylesterase
MTIPSGRNSEEPLPLVFLLHGRGADAHDLADLAPLLDTPAGCRFVFPNAPKPFEIYPGMTAGWTWFEGWPPQHESLVESRMILLQFCEEALRLWPAPENRFIIGGFSQGALMSLDAGLRMSPAPRGILVMSGGLYERDLPPLEERRNLPVLVAHGENDEVVPVNYARRARRVLEDGGLDVEYVEYPMAHQIVQEEVDVVRRFIERALGR